MLTHSIPQSKTRPSWLFRVVQHKGAIEPTVGWARLLEDDVPTGRPVHTPSVR